MKKKIYIYIHIKFYCYQDCYRYYDIARRNYAADWKSPIIGVSLEPTKLYKHKAVPCGCCWLFCGGGSYGIWPDHLVLFSQSFDLYAETLCEIALPVVIRLLRHLYAPFSFVWGSCRISGRIIQMLKLLHETCMWRECMWTLSMIAVINGTGSLRQLVFLAHDLSPT